MLTRAQTDRLVEELRVRAMSHGWPEHQADQHRNWLREGAVVIHVGPRVIAIRAWTGSVLRTTRTLVSTEGPRLANEEFSADHTTPDEAARLVAMSAQAAQEYSVSGSPDDGQDAFDDYRSCPDHDLPEIGCGACGLPVIERVVPCGCPLPRRYIGDRPNIRAITMQIDHHRWCPGYGGSEPVEKPVESARPETEIVRPKTVTRREITSLTLFDRG